MKYCNVCGYENYDDAKFCQKCGNNIAEAQIQGEAVVTEEIITKNSNKIGMVLGIIALGLLLPSFSVYTIGDIIFNERISILFFESVVCCIIFSSMIVISSIGLGKSIRDKNLVGKILNPIALGIGAIAFTSVFNQLLECFA